MKAMVDFQCPLIYQKVKTAVVIPKRMHQKPNRCLSQSSAMGARTKFRITTQKPDVGITLNPYEMECTEGTHVFLVECNPSRNLRITRQQRTRGECSMYVHSSTKVYFEQNKTQKNNKTSPEESGVQILLTSFQLPLMHCGVRDHLQQHDGDLVENCRGDKVMLHKLSESCGR